MINQTGKPAGVAGQAREDLDLGVPVQLSASGGPFFQYLWRVLWKPIDILTNARATAALTTPKNSTTLLTPIDVTGTYFVELTVDSGSGLGALETDIARKTFYAGPTLASDPRKFPRRQMAVGETSEHNAPDALDPTGNPDGWARERAKWDLIVQTLLQARPPVTSDFAAPATQLLYYNDGTTTRTLERLLVLPLDDISQSDTDFYKFKLVRGSDLVTVVATISTQVTGGFAFQSGIEVPFGMDIDVDASDSLLVIHTKDGSPAALKARVQGLLL